MLCIDVTNKYINSVDKCQGIISYDEGYYTDTHTREISVAKWLCEFLGGNIRLLKESDFDGIKTPDYIWNGKYWELKTISSLNNADKLLQRAIKQIKMNPGGVILDLQENISIEKIERQAERRVSRSHINNIDLMFIKNKILIKVVRYKK